MDLVLSPEHELVRDSVREFAANEIAPQAARYDESREFPIENFKKCAAMNLTGMMVAEKYGGAGMDSVSYVIAIEELSRFCASTGVVISVNNSLYCHPVEHFADEASKDRLLAPYARGEKVGCFALSEPGAGSDPAGMRTTAVRDGDQYILNGSKVFVTNGTGADAAVVFAVTDPEKKHKGISAFVVERDLPGYGLGKHEVKLGITSSGSVEIVLEDCRIPASHLLGKEGDGFKIAMNTLDGGRIGIAAQAVGIARGALEESTRYASERQQFGKPIGAFQAIQFMLADMATEIDAARLLTYRAAWHKDQGSRYSEESAMAKLFASEVAMRATTKGIQIFGGYGYMRDYPMERFFRDAKVTEIYEGTSEIQRLVIASGLLRD
jgi:alkylation response protein AidB-like acyl-CoA dehydrogenase